MKLTKSQQDFIDVVKYKNEEGYNPSNFDHFMIGNLFMLLLTEGSEESRKSCARALLTIKESHLKLFESTGVISKKELERWAK